MSITRTLCTILIAFSSFAAWPYLASANTVVYILSDHSRGALGPNYGLRVDELTSIGTPDNRPDSQNNGPDLSFDLSSALMRLFYDPMAATASIFGKAFDPDTNMFWSIDFILSGIDTTPNISNGMGGFWNGFTATGGMGTVCYDPASANTCTNIIGKQNSSGDAFLFLDDSHRMPDDPPWTGRGWITCMPGDANCGGMWGNYNDFLFDARIVPIPAALPLFGTGLAVLVFMGWRRKRQAAA